MVLECTTETVAVWCDPYGWPLRRRLIGNVRQPLTFPLSATAHA